MIQKNAPFFVGKWMELSVKYESVMKLFFDTLYNPELYKENVFLNNVAALEIYHRINHPNFDNKTSNSYQVNFKRILSKIKLKNDRDWLISRLEKKKEIHLYARIVSIAEKTTVISNRILKDIPSFAKKVSNTRNYLTHFDPKNKEKGISNDEELIELIGKTRVLLQIQILLDLGFSELDVDTCIKRAIANWHSWNR